MTMTANRFHRRLFKELKDMKECGESIGLNLHADQPLNQWLVDVNGASGTQYDGESYTLCFTFGENYPFEAPEVIFVGPSIPVHPHVYSNGHICLSILAEHWSPALSVRSVCLSVLSMLSSATVKERPIDNAQYTSHNRKFGPKSTKWVFHDDNV